MEEITRLAIAVAGYVVSTDDTFENIVVKREHIDYAVKFMVDLYDNETFRFKQFVQQERRLRDVDEDGVALLQRLYNSNPTIMLHLENVSNTTRNNMNAIAGLSTDDFSKFINNLVKGLFVQFHGYGIVPTERFRKGMTRISRNAEVGQVGQVKLDGLTN